MKVTKLGRIYQPDERDEMFPMKLVVDGIEKDTRSYKYWYPSAWWGDQGMTPHCVGFAWVHWLAAGPITQKSSREVRDGKPADPHDVYRMAQIVDEWEGEDYDGTSVRAGAKVLRSHSYIKNYTWAWNIDDVIDALLYAGPIVVGTYWTNDMFYPNEDGFIKATGKNAGGHAYLLDGINVSKGVIRIKNSWGRSWGKNGFAYISIDDMEKLIRNYGEACLAVELDKQLSR